MKIRKRFFVLIIMAMLITTVSLTGCESSKEATTTNDDPLVVYLWDTDLIKDLSPYIHKQFPNEKIEFVAGNNDTDLYSYIEEHGKLPDIITVRRFSGTDAQNLQPYLLDFSAYDVVSEYSSYSLQYYKNNDGSINWLPICGIPQTIIANKTLFDQYHLKLPQNYKEYVKACQIFHENGIKPYALDLAEDWSSHEMVQAGGIDELTSLEGISWRSNAESTQGNIVFDDTMWNKIFSNTATLLKDSYFTEEDLSYDTQTAMQLFVEGKAAMFHGSPVHLKQCQEKMNAELVRIPYFSQSSNESFIYMTPSLHIAFNKNLEKNSKRLKTAMRVLECMISEKGQKLIANGDSMISFNPSVSSIVDDMTGLESEIENNEYYIRYSSQKSFSASVKAVYGLINGTMNADQAYNAFKNEINSKTVATKSIIHFKKTYSLSLNNQNGRDAASSILTTVKKDNKAQLALAPYYYFTSSIYKGKCNESRLNLMIANKPDPSSLYLEQLTGKQIKKLVNQYLTSNDSDFYPMIKYELPIASGMKMIVKSDKTGFTLKKILVNGKKIDEKKKYTILLTDDVISVLEKMNPADDLNPLNDITLSSAWIKAMKSGNQPAKPEDYIAIQE